MNNPNQDKIQRWLRGELEGSALEEMEKWAEKNADTFEPNSTWPNLRKAILKSYSTDQEPPYTDFFNKRIQNTIEDASDQNEATNHASILRRMNWIFGPTALAGMALCFYLGTRIDNPAEKPASSFGLSGEVYTPALGIKADVSLSGGSTVITLDGLEEIPQSLDIVSGQTSIGSSPLMLAKMERNSR